MGQRKPKPQENNQLFEQFILECGNELRNQSLLEAAAFISDCLNEQTHFSGTYPTALDISHADIGVRTRIETKDTRDGNPSFYVNTGNAINDGYLGIIFKTFAGGEKSTDKSKHNDTEPQKNQGITKPWNNAEIRAKMFNEFKDLSNGNRKPLTLEEQKAFSTKAKKAQEKWEKQQAEQQAKKAKLEAQEKQKQQQRLDNAKKEHQEALNLGVNFDHCQYLVKKHIAEHTHLNTAAYNPNTSKLYIPAYNKHGVVQTIQTIDNQGSKKFMGASKGAFALVGCSLSETSTLKRILVCEGVATAVSLETALNVPVLVGFDAGNINKAMLSFLTYWKEKNPNTPQPAFTIAADNDCWHDKKNQQGVKKQSHEINAGISAAQEAIEKLAPQGVQVNYCYPEFSQESEKENPTDYNDLHVLEGLQAVADKMKPVEYTPYAVSDHAPQIEAPAPQEQVLNAPVLSTDQPPPIDLELPPAPPADFYDHGQEFTDQCPPDYLAECAPPIDAYDQDCFVEETAPQECPPEYFTEPRHKNYTKKELAPIYGFVPYDKGNPATLFNVQLDELIKAENIQIKDEHKRSLMWHRFHKELSKERNDAGFFDYHYPCMKLVDQYCEVLGRDTYENVLYPIINAKNNKWRDNVLGDVSKIKGVIKQTYTGRYVGNFKQYLEPDTKTYLLKCQTGAGKTQSIVAYLKELAGDAPFVGITPLRALCKSTAINFDMANYEDMPKGDIKTDRIIITPNSLHRLKELPVGQYILFIDEIEQILTGYNSSMYKNRYERVTALKALDNAIKNAALVICADANLSANTARLIMKLQGTKGAKLITEHDRLSTRNPYPMTVHIDASAKDDTRLGKFESEIKKTAAKKERFIVACNSSVNTINAVKKMVLSVWKDCHIETSHSDNQGSHFNKAVAKDPDHVTTCDVFIHTTVLSSGISINDKTPNTDGTPHFKRAFFIFWNNGVGSKTNAQLIARYRPQIPADCFIDARQYKEETDLDRIHEIGIAILESDLDTALKNGDRVHAQNLKNTIELLIGSDPQKAGGESLHQHIESNKDRNNFVQNTLGFLRDKYKDVRFDYDKLQRELPEILKLVKDDQKSLVLNADNITPLEALELDTKETRTEYESNQLAKYKIQDYFKEWLQENEITKIFTYQGKEFDIYDFFNDKKAKGYCDNLRKSMTAYKHQEDELPHLNQGKATLKFTGNMLLNTIYDTEKGVFKRGGISEQQAQALCAHIVQHDAVLIHNGIIKKDPPTSVARLLKHVFKNAFGVEVETERKRQKDKVKYSTYKITPESKADLRVLLDLLKCPQEKEDVVQDAFYTKALADYDNDTYADNIITQMAS